MRSANKGIICMGIGIVNDYMTCKENIRSNLGFYFYLNTLFSLQLAAVIKGAPR